MKSFTFTLSTSSFSSCAPKSSLGILGARTGFLRGESIFLYSDVYEFVSDDFLLRGKLISPAFRSKSREELKAGIKKDRILTEEDALLLKQFIQKINEEIN